MKFKIVEGLQSKPKIQISIDEAEYVPVNSSFGVSASAQSVVLLCSSPGSTKVTLYWLCYNGTFGKDFIINCADFEVQIQKQVCYRNLIGTPEL